MTNWLRKHKTEIQELYKSERGLEGDLEFYENWNTGTKAEIKRARKILQQIQEKIQKNINKIIKE